MTFPPSHSLRTPPVNMRPEDEKLFAHECERRFPATKPVTLRKVYVCGSGLCHIDARRIPSPALVSPGVRVLSRQWLKASLLLGRSMRRGKQFERCERVRKGLLLTDVYFDGFFHWFGDVLPKVQALMEYRVDIHDYVILVPATRDAKYVAESFAAYGLNYRVVTAESAVLAEELCYIPRLSPTGNYQPELMRGIRDKMRAKFASPAAGVRLYVSRQQAPKRHLLNERDLSKILLKYGFETVCLEQLSFAKQVELASRCTVLAGLHGAGLTHMLWARPDVRVVEVRGAHDAENNCYYSLASDLGYDYYYVPAQKRIGFRLPHLADYVVDVERFEATIAQALNTSDTEDHARRDLP